MPSFFLKKKGYFFSFPPSKIDGEVMRILNNIFSSRVDKLVKCKLKLDWGKKYEVIRMKIATYLPTYLLDIKEGTCISAVPTYTHQLNRFYYYQHHLPTRIGTNYLLFKTPNLKLPLLPSDTRLKLEAAKVIETWTFLIH